jgi:hypothetical protein
MTGGGDRPRVGARATIAAKMSPDQPTFNAASKAAGKTRFHKNDILRGKGLTSAQALEKG